MYCTIDDMRKLLPDAVTIGDENIGTPVVQNSQAKRSKITTTEANYYIKYASQEIDGRLRPFYSCPLRRINVQDTELLNNISAGSNVNLKVHDSGMFSKGDLIRLNDNSTYENVTVSNVFDMTTVTISSLVNNFLASNTIISILEYPDPIPLMTARLAIAYAFDKLFNAQQAPDISNYGKEQKTLAHNSMDSILTGAVLLFGQEHTGRRFCRISLYDAIKSPAEDIQFGREGSK